MAKFAVVKNGVVENLIEADVDFALSIGAIAAPDWAYIGGTYSGGEFSRSAIPDLYPNTQSARAAMLGFIERLTYQVTSQYPKAEVSAWPSKAEAARAVIADTARDDQVALIQDEADIVGATLADQAAAIVAKAVVFEAIVAKVSGLRQATDAALVAATTSAEREAVLDAATVQAAGLATAYGLTV
jgi:hypothetical protein